MNLVERVINKFSKKAFDPLENIDLEKVVGWHRVGGSSTYGWYQDNQYENGYPSISRIANGFMVIEPYTIDKKGKSVSSNVLDRLYTPNTDMSAVDFREALAVMCLVHDEVRLRIHHKGNSNKFNAEQITGFTFMENYTEDIVGGKRIYKLSNGTTLDDSEVITLKSINPYNITTGFSPAKAARRWTKLDDYIADYERGFFENGAVPAGQMVITARTVADYNDIVDRLQMMHRGAGRNNNIIYTHRPTDQNGSPLNSQIEWVPFSTSNKDLSLKELFEQVNKKIDSVFGVPASIRGVNDSNAYASVRVDEMIFVKYVLNPWALKIWSKFTHELNRVTGGMGIAITYHLETPRIADEDKVRAEALEVSARTVSNLTTQGYTLDSAIEYVKNGEIETLKLSAPKEEEKPEVLSSDDAKGTPSQPIDMYSKQFNEINAKLDALQASHKHSEPRKKQIGQVDKIIYENRFGDIVMGQMEAQVNKAISNLAELMSNKEIDTTQAEAVAVKAIGDTTNKEDREFTEALLALMLPLMNIYGQKQVTQATALMLSLNLKTDDIEAFQFTPKQRKEYQKYLASIANGYNEQTAQAIREVIGQGVLESKTRQEIETDLRKVILGDQNEYRVRRLARTEVNQSEGRASVNAMQNIQNQTGFKIYKVWHTTSAEPCPFCTQFEGKEVPVDSLFLDIGDEVHAGGETFINNWTGIDSAQLHANCNCYTSYRVERI